LKTNVTVPNNATLVLGGLIKQRYTKNNAGVPLLSRIPLIGPLFRSTSSVKSREELVILIRPEVSVGPKESLASSERESEFLKIEPDLEQTLIDRHQRQRTAPEELMRKPAAPGLREYQRNSARPSYYKVERSKK
jgi:type II secretory pathway component GspD/PulD (secretin)